MKATAKIQCEKRRGKQYRLIMLINYFMLTDSFSAQKLNSSKVALCQVATVFIINVQDSYKADD